MADTQAAYDRNVSDQTADVHVWRCSLDGKYYTVTYSNGLPRSSGRKTNWQWSQPGNRCLFHDAVVQHVARVAVVNPANSSDQPVGKQDRQERRRTVGAIPRKRTVAGGTDEGTNATRNGPHDWVFDDFPNFVLAS
jgi:hypothetical protein